MASTILTGNDFLTNSNLALVGQDGNVSINRVRSNDYDVALVSRDAFDFTTGNKSVRFVFSVAPYTTAARPGVFGAGAVGRFASLVDDGTSIEWKGDTFSSPCPGTPDCQTMTKYQCNKYYSADASSSHSIVKTGQCFGTSGDNTHGQLDLTTVETIEGIACGNGFTVIMRNTGVVEVIGNDQGGDIVVPASCVTFDENDRPVSIVAGEDFFVVLKRDGTVVSVGSILTTAFSTIEETIVEMSAGSNFVVLLSLSGQIFSIGGAGANGELTPPSIKALKVSASANRAVILAENGNVYEWGEGLADVQQVQSIPSGSQVIDVIAGESFSMAVLKDRSVVISGSVPAYLSDITGEKSGNAESISEMDDAYDMFPMLRNITGVNIMAGVQEDNLDSTYHKYVAPDNTVKPIVVGRDGFSSVFTGIRGGFKGAIIAKTDNGGDMCFDLRGSEYDPYTATGHLPISTDFITSNAAEKYEVIISFSPFGKMIKFRKVSGEYAQDMPFKHLSVEETGYSAGRVALYVRNAKDFVLDFAEVTDEINASILPADILYRDMDTAVLHTQAAELVVDLADAVETIGDAVTKSSETVRSLNANYKQNLADIFSRLETLEAN